MSPAVVVTGAARGIGRAIALKLDQIGFTVIAVDMAPELDLPNSVPIQVDLTTDAGVEAVAKAAAGVDLVGLVNNAGITRDARLVNLSDQDFEAVLNVNLGVAYRLSDRLAPMISDRGAIVNIASRAYLGNFGQFNYSMSKGGVVGLTRAMALSLAPRLRVNAVAPGLIGTEMAMAIPDDVLGRMVDAIPLARMGDPAEVADLVAYLLGSESSYITGEVVVVGGGRSLS